MSALVAAVLSDADYTLMQPADWRGTVREWARRANLPPERLLRSVQRLEHDTGQGRYKTFEDWLQAVIYGMELSSPADQRALRRGYESIDAFHFRRVLPYPGYHQLSEVIRNLRLQSAIVSGKGWISRDATQHHLAWFDHYGFSCEDGRWNKGDNPHAYREMAERLNVPLPNCVVLEDNPDYARDALADGAQAYVLLHPGGAADASINNGTESVASMVADGLEVYFHLTDLVDRLIHVFS